MGIIRGVGLHFYGTIDGNFDGIFIGNCMGIVMEILM